MSSPFSPSLSRRRASLVSPTDREELLRLDQRLAARRASNATRKIYRGWARRFLAHAAGRHREPRIAIDRFLDALRGQACSPASQRQALAALGFYFREVRGIDAAPLLRRHRPGRREDDAAVCQPVMGGDDGAVEAARRLVHRLAQATGRSMTEILALRIGDVDLERGQLKLRRDGVARRRAMPVAIAPELRESLMEQIGESWRLHQLDFLAWLDRHEAARVGGSQLPTEVFRRQPLFPTLAPATRRGPLRRRLAYARIVIVDDTRDRQDNGLRDCVARRPDHGVVTSGCPEVAAIAD